MKTKRIDFDIDLAKKIQAGEAQGRIVTRDGQQVRIICWDRADEEYTIVALLRNEDGSEYVDAYMISGKNSSVNKTGYDLFLEVPDDTPQFQPYDKVLVRDDEYNNWQCGLFSHYDKDDEYPYYCIGSHYAHCIPYEGNEHLVGTTNEPKEGGAR